MLPKGWIILRQVEKDGIVSIAAKREDGTLASGRGISIDMAMDNLNRDIGKVTVLLQDIQKDNCEDATG